MTVQVALLLPHLFPPPYLSNTGAKVAHPLAQLPTVAVFFFFFFFFLSKVPREWEDLLRVLVGLRILETQ